MKVVFTKLGKLCVNLDPLDHCFSCKNNNKCPLIQMLEDDIAVLKHENIIIYKCGFHKKRGHKK